MSPLQELLRRLECAFDESLVHECAQLGWLLPKGEDDEKYDAADIARVRLIHTMREEFQVNNAAVPVILSLLDQLHGTRYLLKRTLYVMSSQPDEVHAELAAMLEEELKR